MSKPRKYPSEPFADNGRKLQVQDNWLWVPLRQEWRDISKKPEEKVRQEFIRHLVVECGYLLDQMDQERRTMHGHNSPRVDIVVWQSVKEKNSNRGIILVVECKAENIDIQVKDYYQGESYTRACGADIFVAHNARQTAVFKLVPGAPGEFVQINEFPKAIDWGDAKRMNQIKNSLRTFNRDEYQKLLFDCHSLLRDVHAMEPGRAFDTISKVLFIKMYIERMGLHGTFSVGYLDRREETRMSNEPPVHVMLFNQTKDYYKADEIFAQNDMLNISEATFRDLVKKLERFNLSQTGDDIKGIAFERFLGATFRGELGQFFTPRPVVDFMVDLIDPQENERICDPAAGSGGFLIRTFEHIRSKIAADIQTQKDSVRTIIEAQGLDPDEEKVQIDAAFALLNKELLPSDDNNTKIGTRVGRLAWSCIYGCDKEPRAARTAKMNMIMHGDGHGGIHYHDGLVDINGIFSSFRCIRRLGQAKQGLLGPCAAAVGPRSPWAGGRCGTFLCAYGLEGGSHAEKGHGRGHAGDDPVSVGGDGPRSRSGWRGWSPHHRRGWLRRGGPPRAGAGRSRARGRKHARPRSSAWRPRGVVPPASGRGRSPVAHGR